jgi:endonuclease-3
MKDSDIHSVVRILRREIRQWKVPVVGHYADDPFTVLISCILSLRTKDATTQAASERLFAAARTPQTLLQLPLKRIEKLIFPVGFYRTKARVIHGICADLLSRFKGQVPDTIDELLTLKGVGRKTANLVVTLGYKKPGICVDVHVHRISNRLGYVKTKTPAETETALREKLPKKYWITFNDLLVTYGQNLCAPTSPWCSRCAIRRYCARTGVSRSR